MLKTNSKESVDFNRVEIKKPTPVPAKPSVGLLSRVQAEQPVDFSRIKKVEDATKLEVKKPQISDIGKGAKSFAKEVAQGMARGYGALGAYLAAGPMAYARGVDTKFQPEGKIQEAIYGTDKPFGFQEVGEEYPFVKKGSKLAPILAIGGVIGDLLPGGKAAKIGLGEAAKALAKVTDAGDVFKALKAILPDISDDAAKTASRTISQVDDVVVIRKTLDDLAGAIKKPVKEIAEVIGKRERGFVSSAKEILPDAPKIAGQYIPRSTDDLAMRAKNLIKESIEEAEHIALTRSDDSAVAVASELLKHYADEAVDATDDAVRFALYEKAADVANTLAPKLTEQGRAIQAASILGRLTPEGQIRFAAKEILRWNAEHPRAQIAELTAQQAGGIYEEMLAITRMADGDEKAIRFKQLQDTIRKLIPSTVMDKITSVWKAGLLTGIKTTGLNIFANVSHASTEIAKDVPASMADWLMSLATGKRTLKATVRGVGEGVQEGAKKGWRYFNTGYDVRDIGIKLDYRQVNFKNKILQKYTDTVFRLLGTEDQPFYYGALKRSLYNQALAQASNEGVKGAGRLSFVRNLVESPTEDMLRYATIDAETAVFQNKTALGGIARGIQKLGGGAGEFVVPFGRTPSAVAMQVINYSPAGAFVEIGKQIARGTFDQRLLAQAIGRSTVGTGVMWVGQQLYEKGMMTLNFPKDERERELWKAEGKKPNSIKFGDSWRTIQSLGPAGNVMLIGGHLSSALKETGSATEAVIQAFWGTLSSFTEQTFLKGVNDVMAALADPQREAKGVAASFLSSTVPTIINDVARATDPKERRTTDNDFKKEILNRLQSRLPALRQQLEPQVTVLGDELARIGNPLEVMADPTRPAPATPTPVNQELRRLMDAGYKVSPTLLGDRAGFKALTAEENTELWKLAGQITDDKLGSLFSLDKYEALPDEKKAKAVEIVVDKSKVSARAGMVLKLTEGLKDEALRKKLSELKAGGLMTQEVFSKYQELR